MPANEAELRREVRELLVELEKRGLYKPGLSSWAEYDREVSRSIAKRGWIGMTWPKKYGGHERSEMERYVVTEELLASGVPLRGHWSADRQNGPLLLQFGNDWQKENILPQFAAGEAACAIGLSEPDSGSDLAAIRTRGVKVDGGWKVNGRKVWTSNVHNSQYLMLLLRTGSEQENRHAGVSRMLLDLTWKGITIRPIIHMTGEHDFNEVIFDDLFVPDNMVVGEPGNAWKQLVGAELARERSAPDRWTAQIGLLRQMVDKITPDPEPSAAQAVGRQVAHLWTLKNMSASIAGMLERGMSPSVESSIVKDLGTHYEQEMAHIARSLVGEGERALLPEGDPFAASLRFNLLYSPALTIRGGTCEILRNNIARGLGLR
jgi:alkylation response protein AidB-like acyl-CoA dehydrogenase